MALLKATLKAEILKITAPTPPATFPSTNEEVATAWSTAVGNYFKEATNPPGAVATAVLAQEAFKLAMEAQLAIASISAIDSGLVAFVTVPGLNVPPAIVPPPVLPVVAVWMAAEIAASKIGTVTADDAAERLSSVMDLWFRTGTTAASPYNWA